MVPKSVMAAPMLLKHETLGKRIFESSSFVNPKSKHASVVLKHHFNCSIGLTLPDIKQIPDDIHNLCMDEKAFVVEELSLVDLIDLDLIGAFVKRGRLCLLSHRTRIDTDDCIAVLPTGQLILHLTKDTYECLGLEGKPAEFPRKKPEKFVIQIDLTEKCFKPGKKKYQRVLKCLKDQDDLRFDVITTWTPDDEALCPSSIQKYFQVKGHHCQQISVKCQQRLLKHLDVPILDSEMQFQNVDNLEYDQNDVFEWLGGVAVGTTLNALPDDYTSTYCYPGPTRETKASMYVQYKGFFSPSTIYQVLEKLRNYIKTSKAQWGSLTVHGFMDSPVSWGMNEHGFLCSGDNIYTFLSFPNERYWLYRAFSYYDVVT